MREQKLWDLHCQDITFRVDKTIMRNVEVIDSSSTKGQTA